MRVRSILAAVILLSVATGHAAEVLSDELDALEGRWELFSVEYGGERSKVERDPQTWVIKGDQLARFTNSKNGGTSRIAIEPHSMPKHLDLVPIEVAAHKDEEVDKQWLFTRTKCLYTLNGNELSVALTFEFAPGSPEEEKQRAIEYAKKRPDSFDTKKGDVAVLIFERAEKD